MPEDLDKCFVCSFQVERIPDSPDQYKVECTRCGRYTIQREAAAYIDRYDNKKHLISGYIRNENEKGRTPDITDRGIEEILSSTPMPRTVDEKMDWLIKYLGDSTQIGRGRSISCQRDYPIIYAVDNAEFNSIIDYLEDEEVIAVGDDTKSEFWDLDESGSPNNTRIRLLTLTANGWRKNEEIRKGKIGSNQAFVAMSFRQSLLDEEYDKAIKPAIVACGYDPINMFYLEHNEDINERIIVELRRSRFVVADFTDQRGGVYFEAGFARGLDIPVIWCCSESDREKLHFDTEHFQYIFYEDTTTLYEKLLRRIEYTIGVSTQEKMDE